MKQIILLLIVGMIFGGCKKQLSEVPDAPLVVKGLLFGGEPINNIYLERVATTREFEQQVNEPVLEADVKLLVNDEIIELSPDPDRAGYFISELDTVILDAEYELSVDYEGQKLTASCLVPDKLQINNETASVDVLENPEPDDLILDLSWDDLGGGVEYLISLNVEEEELVFLPFAEGEGEFNDVYALPIRDNFALLNGSYFTYKGRQVVTVFSISKEYSAYLNYLPSSFDRSLYKAPNNIENGYGVFAGLTGTEVEVTLID